MPYSTIFTIGRMNPPTPGHFEFIENIFTHALEHHIAKIHIILSSKTDKYRNPLTPEVKRDFILTYGIPYIKQKLMESYLYNDSEIENIDVDILLTHEHNATCPNDIYSSVSHILASLKGKNKALFITGTDSTFTFDKKVSIIRIPRTNPISGTIVRTLAFENQKAFRYIYRYYNIYSNDLEDLLEEISLLNPPSEHDIANAIEYLRTIQSRYLI